MNNKVNSLNLVKEYTKLSFTEVCKKYEVFFYGYSNKNPIKYNDFSDCRETTEEIKNISSVWN